MNRPLLATYLCILAAYTGLVTHGTGDMFGPEWLSGSYDSLARNLLHGEAHVDPGAISFEGLKRSGKTYMYFGPFPALIHMVVNALVPGHSGEVGRVSCLVAAMLSVLLFGIIILRSLRLNSSLQERHRTILATILIASFSLGTPVLYLVSSARIFHEASLWGLCGALLAIYGILLLCTGHRRPLLGRFIFATALTISILSRITFALPICVAAPIVYFWNLIPEGRLQGSVARTATWRLIAMSPAMLGVIIQLWYNNERFGSPLVFFDYTTFYITPRQIGGEFNIARIPTTLWHYFGFSWDYFSHVPPYIRMASSEIARPEIFMRYWREQTISLTLAACSTMLFAALGVFAVARGKAPRLLLVYSGCLFTEVFAILSYFFITERYAADFLPLMTVGVVLTALTISYNKRLTSVLSVLTVVSIAATVLSDLDWNMALNQHAPNDFRRRLAQAFLPPVVLEEGGERIYLSDLTPPTEGNAPSTIRFNRSALGNLLTWNGTVYEKGIGMTANSSAKFPVAPGFARFRAIVTTAAESTHRNEAAMQFRVSNDKGEVLFNSSTMRARSLPEICDVPLRNTASVTLSVVSNQTGPQSDFGNWNLASFVKSQDELPVDR